MKPDNKKQDKMVKFMEKETAFDQVKQKGSEHYKTGSVEPIDLYKSGGMLQSFALCSIIKYAYRNRERLNVSDLDKIIHYAEILKVIADEGSFKSPSAGAEGCIL